MDHHKSSMRRWSSLAEELEALEQNPVAQSLLDDLEKQSPERVEAFLAELSTMADLEDER